MINAVLLFIKLAKYLKSNNLNGNRELIIKQIIPIFTILIVSILFGLYTVISSQLWIRQNKYINKDTWNVNIYLFGFGNILELIIAILYQIHRKII